MVQKKLVSVVLIISLIIASLALVSAELDITKKQISTVAIKDLNKPAMFTLDLTNKGITDSFSIYSTVGLDMLPKESFEILAGETKSVAISIFPTLPLKVSPDYINFEYKLKGTNTPVQIDELAISIVNLKDAFEFYIDSINPDSETAKIHFNNKYGESLENVHMEFSSVFFSETLNFSATALEKKELDAKLDKTKMRELLAGPYIVNAKVRIGEVSGETSTIMKFEEKAGIETKELTEGFFARRTEIEKLNKGNMNTDVSIVITKNLFSALFTTVNIDPSRKEFSGLKINYVYQKQIAPGESLKVVAKTNWWILILIIVIAILLWYIVDKYVKNKLVISKHILRVRTKGGEFALKITLNVKARDYVERIRLLDRLPPMVKIFENFGNVPEKLDEKNRRVEWNMQALAKGEQRTFSYIIYSKIGMVGRFELPKATAIYEFEGKVKEAESNDAFYSNESKS